MMTKRKPFDSKRPRRSAALSANFGSDAPEHDTANIARTLVANTRLIDMRAIFAKTVPIASIASSTQRLTEND
jgi:hypothetical protein